MFEKLTKITDKTAFNFFLKQADKFTTFDNLSIKEKIAKVKIIKYKTLLLSAVYGILGVILLYIPQYYFPELFSQKKIHIPFTNIFVNLSILELFYGFFLVVIEIWLLMRNDIRAVCKVAAVYGYFTRKKNDVVIDEITELIYIGMGKDEKKVPEVGINPFQNVSRVGVALIRLFFMLKAMLTNFLFKIIVKRLLGRLAVRTVVDLAGIPIYAFWNAYASSVVIRKINMRMLARNEMLNIGNQFHSKFANNKEFIELIYDTFGYIAITKKKFYPADFVFSKYFLSIFNIKIKKEHFISENYLEKLENSNNDVKLAIGQLLIIGFLIDGKLGRLEITVIKKLQQKNIINYKIKEIKKWTKQYQQGESFDIMFES